MNLSKITLLSSIFLMTACGEAEKGAAGAECTTDADCADGLECQMHEDEGEADHGECEAHDEEEHSDEEGGEEAAE